MAWTKYQIAIGVLLVITGSINTLATKWADDSKAVGRDGGEPRKFNHPFLQAVGMFFGEFTCLIAFKALYLYYTRKRQMQPEELPSSIAGNQDFNPVIFLAPAMCDMVGTSIMYVGLNLTYASTFQMLRGAVIIFTGFLSVAFLNRKLKGYQWVGIVVVLVGLVIVGASDMVFKENDQEQLGVNSIITGDLLIIIAQVIAATQMVVEEKFVSKYNVAPLQAVGWEGLFGFIILGVMLVPMYFIPVGNEIFKNPGGQMEDALDGFVQMGNNWQILVGFIGTVLSISFFNFAGISVTKELSATTRMVLDSVRTFIIWIFSLAVKWQHFNVMQPIGFGVLLVGMCLYNNVVIRPLLISKGCIKPADDQRHLVVVADDEQADTADRV